MADDIIWQDPPDPLRRQGPRTPSWRSRLRLVVENPERWAKVQHYWSRTGSDTVARRLRKGEILPGRWETATRCTDPEDMTQGYDLYVRYMGDGDA
jgi:hypothetical protein